MFGKSGPGLKFFLNFLVEYPGGGGVMPNDKLISFLEKILVLSPGQQEIAIDLLDDYFEEIKAEVSHPKFKHPHERTPEEEKAALLSLREYIESWPDR